MDNEITNEYISNAIDELTGIIGVKENINHSELVTLVRRKQTKKAIKVLASQLGLPIEINLSYVPKDYRSNINNGFQSQGLTRTDSSGRGVAGIIAQVSIPSHMPLYGSPALTNFPISVKVSEDCNEYPETFIAVMAHELSHVLLYSLMHPQKDNEFYTDLVAMLLGLSQVIEKGRKVKKVRELGDMTETQIITYGYLSDKQFAIARNKIKSILIERKNIKIQYMKEISELRKQYLIATKTLLQFTEFLGHVDKNRNSIAIKHRDAFKIIMDPRV